MMTHAIRYFGPQWFGTVMGTGALAISLALVSERWDSNRPLEVVSQIFLFLTIAMFALYIVPWTIRFFKYPTEVNQDINHLIKGQFFPTMPISLIVIGIALAKIGPTMWSVSSLRIPIITLFIAGTVGIFIFGFILVTVMYRSRNVELGHGVYAWYIPPVSHLIIPVLGFILIARYYSGTFMGDAIFIVSMATWGIGFFLFLFVGSIVYHRYAYGELPLPRVAPTFMIGIAPTAIMTVALVKLAPAINGVSFGLDSAQVLPVIKLFALAMWGFSVWWFILTFILFFYYLKTMGHPFVFAWWAYTFPLGAFAISAGAIGSIMDFPAFWYNLYVVNFLLLFMWIIIVCLTIRLVWQGKAFMPE